MGEHQAKVAETEALGLCSGSRLGLDREGRSELGGSSTPISSLVPTAKRGPIAYGAVADSLLDECPQEMRGLEWNYVKRLCHLEQWTYSGHERNIWCVAVSPDGSKVASGSGQSIFPKIEGLGRLAVCDAATGPARSLLSMV